MATWEIEIEGKRGEIHVPGAWEAQGYSGKAGVNDPVIYRRSFDVPKTWEGAEIDLCFGAVSYYAEVFVNGVKLGDHEGLWTEFGSTLTDMIRFDQPNEVEVRVIKPGYKGDRFPYRDVLVGFLPYVFDTFGGIWQDVKLVAHRSTFLSDVSVKAHADTGIIEAFAQTASGQMA